MSSDRSESLCQLPDGNEGARPKSLMIGNVSSRQGMQGSKVSGVNKENPSSVTLMERTTQAHASEMLVVAGSIITPAPNLVRADGLLHVDGITVRQRTIPTAYLRAEVRVVAVSME